MPEVDEAVVQLVKNCGNKLTNTINWKNKPFPQVAGVPPAQVIVPHILHPANAPPGSHLGLASAVHHAGAGAPNAPTANPAGPAQFQPAQAAGPDEIPSPAESPRAKPTCLDSGCKCWSVRKPNPASPSEFPSVKPTSLNSLCKCWSVRKPNLASPGKSPRGTPTSLYGVCRAGPVRKRNAK